MNILGIVGSVRKESIHKQILKHYKEIAKDYFELSEGSIVELPMFDGENTDNTAVVKLAEQVANADGVIFFSPEYNYSIPGSLKNALDHLSIVSSQPFVGKPAAIVGASPGAAGTARMQYHLRQVGVCLDIQFLNKPEVMISDAFSKMADGRITDSSTIEFLSMHAKAFEAFVKKHN